MSTSTRDATATSWQEANHRYLLTELERLRLLLRRRIVWLRTQWKHDPLQSYPGLVISEEQADRLLAGQEREAQQRFYRENAEALAATRALAAVMANIERQAHSFHERKERPALEVLARLFQLSGFARDLVLLCLAPELDGAFERLFAYVQDDVTRKRPTLHLAEALFGVGDSKLAWEALAPDGVLRRLRLLAVENTPSGALAAHGPLYLSERVRDYLLGFNRLDDAVAEWVGPVPPSLLPPSHEGLRDRLASAVHGRETGWPLVGLVGPNGSGRQALAGALCDRLHLRLLELRLDRLPASGPERQEAFRILEREALLSQLALYVDAGEERSRTSAASTALAEVMERLSVFLLVGSHERVAPTRDALVVRLAKPEAAEQRLLWQHALDGIPHTVNSAIDDVVEQFDFGPTAIARTVAAAQGQAHLESEGEGGRISAERLWQACREEATQPLDDLAQRIRPCHTWHDIVLPDDISRQLREIAAQVAHRAMVYERWGFGAKLNRGRGISALFSGPSGTGKTMAAEILAGHLALDLFRIDLSGVVSKYIGETEKNLRRVFDAAERSGAILFFDEADALFGKRSEVKDSHDRYANIEINYLLQRMEDYRGLAILATNMKSHMDQAFLRRLRYVVDFPFPDSARRALIWNKVFPPEAPREAVQYEALSRLEIAGGSIKNIAVNAAFLASEEGGPIRMEHLMQAARREYAKIEKLPLESEFGPYLRLVTP